MHLEFCREGWIQLQFVNYISVLRLIIVSILFAACSSSSLGNPSNVTEEHLLQETKRIIEGIYCIVALLILSNPSIGLLVTFCYRLIYYIDPDFVWIFVLNLSYTCNTMHEHNMQIEICRLYIYNMDKKKYRQVWMSLSSYFCLRLSLSLCLSLFLFLSYASSLTPFIQPPPRQKVSCRWLGRRAVIGPIPGHGWNSRAGFPKQRKLPTSFFFSN